MKSEIIKSVHLRCDAYRPTRGIGLSHGAQTVALLSSQFHVKINIVRLSTNQSRGYSFFFLCVKGFRRLFDAREWGVKLLSKNTFVSRSQQNDRRVPYRVKMAKQQPKLEAEHTILNQMKMLFGDKLYIEILIFDVELHRSRQSRILILSGSYSASG